MSGSLASLTPGQQIEAVYIAYFDRAADGGGYLYWSNDFAFTQAGGASAAVAATNIAQSFSVQHEATALYALLASPLSVPAQPRTSTNPILAAEIDVFLRAVYDNLFNRVADPTGEAYWATQILSGAVSVGSAIYAIANGATGADLVVLDNKIAAATYFTTQATVANLGLTSPLDQTFLAAALNAVSSVTDSASVSASEAATDAWIGAHTTVARFMLTSLPGTLSAQVTDTGGTTYAALIDAASSSGLVQQGPDATYTAGASNLGEQIIGSATGANVMIGTVGNDAITGTLSTTKADTIATGGGADAIGLAPNHRAADHVELYPGHGLLTNQFAGGDGGIIVRATPGSIVDVHDTAQAGWWGVNADGLNNQNNSQNNVGDLVCAFGQGHYVYGTSADASTVANFMTARDVVDVSVGAFSHLLSNLDKSGSAGFDPVTVAASSAGAAHATEAIFTAALAPGSNLAYAAGTDHANVLLLAGPFANAAAVAQSLGASGDAPGGLTFGNGLTLSDLGQGRPDGLEYAGHVLVAYAAASGNGSVVIADLDIAATAPIISGTGAGSHYDAIAGRTIAETIGVSDLVTLTGVPLASLQTHNIHFVA